MLQNKLILRAAFVLSTAAAMPAMVIADEGYLERRDTITLGLGEAVEYNKATQTIDRWPPSARRDRWLSDGERARVAIERYRTRAPGIRPEVMQPSATSEDVTK